MVLAQDLRNAVLQAAMQGKLTEQLATDSSVDELLDAVLMIKQDMINKGELKKTKIIPSDAYDTIFDIPNNWRWVRMQEFLDVRDGTHDSPKYVSEGIPFLTSKNISNGYLDFSNVDYITQEDADKINQRSRVDDGDILLAMIGSIGNPVKVRTKRNFAIKNMALIKSIPNSNINMDYVLLLLRYMQIQFKQDSSGGVQSFVSLSYLREFSVPLPPIEEQQRIVERVNALMAQIDEYEKIEQELVALKADFPGDMKAAILQSAMQGKLTEQLDTDSSVDGLLKESLLAKEKLIESKAIKSEKVLPLDEIDSPFDIPDSWKFVRLGHIIILQSGQDMTPDKYSDIIQDGIPYLTGASNIINGKIMVNRWTKQPKNIAKKGDLLITCKGTVGQMAILNEDKVHIARQIMGIRPLGNVNILYIMFCLENFISAVQSKAKSMIPGIDRKVILNLIIPIPPREEQQRIVERLNALLPLCENLI